MVPFVINLTYWFNVVIFIISTIFFLFIIWLFAKNPKNFFKTKSECTMPEIILNAFPKNFPANFDENLFSSLPSYLSNMSSILMVCVFPYKLWAEIINNIIMQIRDINDYYFLSNKKEEALDIKYEFKMQLYEFLNEFKKCLTQENIDKCSLIMWDMRQKIDNDRKKIEKLLSSSQ